jgi:hypothetical protein
MTSRFTLPASPHRRRLLVAAFLAAAIFALAGSGNHRAVAVTPALASSGELTASERHRRVMRLVSEVVEHQHYRQTALDDGMSAQIYEHYLTGGGQSLASDIAGFEHLRNEPTGIKDADAFRVRIQALPAAQPVFAVRDCPLDTEPDFALDETFRWQRPG